MGRGTTPVLSVLIVTWNCRDDVLRCLASVHDQAGGVPLEVIVVDNASSDGTAAAVRAAFPDAVVVENRGNAGFPRANNQALSRATGRYVLFLNPDTEVGEGTLAACVAALDADGTLGMVGCRLVYPDGSTQYEGGRRPYRLADVVFEGFYLHMFFPRHPLFARQLMGDWDHRGERDVEAIMGAFMMARREVATAVGGLPEDVFMYHEDLSFCLRVRRAGWRIRYLGGVTTTHHSGRSAARSDATLYLLEGEAKVRLVRESQGRVAGAAARAVFGFRSLLRLCFALATRPLPGLGGARRRYPRVFNARQHWHQLVWSVFPRAVRGLIPRAAEGSEMPETEAPRRVAADHDHG